MTPPPCRLLDWDTAFFGCRIGRITATTLGAQQMQAVLAWANAQSVDCLYFLVDPDSPASVRLAEENGFHLQDVRLCFTIARPDSPPPSAAAPGPFRLAQPGDYQALRDTARSAYTLSRFYTDPRFSETKCAALYDTWLRKSIETDYADAVWVAQIDGQATAFVTCHVNRAAASGEIGLVGVAPAARGQRIGSRLVRRVLGWFWEQGVQQVEVVTQGRNIGAQRLYQACGFQTHSIRLWYHAWLTDCRAV